MQAQWIRHGTNIAKNLNAFQGLVTVMICHNLHNMSILKGPDECVMQKGWSTRARPHLLERLLTQTVMRSVWKKKPNPLVHQNNIWSWNSSWSSVTQLIYFLALWLRALFYYQYDIFAKWCLFDMICFNLKYWIWEPTSKIILKAAFSCLAFLSSCLFKMIVHGF